MSYLRRLSPVVLLAFLSLFPARSAHAQAFSVYVTYAPLRASNVATGSGQETNFWANGVGGGVTVNVLPLPAISLGFDFRGSTRPGTDGADTGMAGIRLGIHPPVIRIKPYIEAAAGYLGTRSFNAASSGSTYNNHYVAYEIIGGVDYPLMRFLDLRAIEIGGGTAYNTSGTNASILTINTGLVLHF
jgi:hypothetical protein